MQSNVETAMIFKNESSFSGFLCTVIEYWLLHIFSFIPKNKVFSNADPSSSIRNVHVFSNAWPHEVKKSCIAKYVMFMYFSIQDMHWKIRDMSSIGFFRILIFSRWIFQILNFFPIPNFLIWNYSILNFSNLSFSNN